jgi:hypothetical protein
MTFCRPTGARRPKIVGIEQMSLGLLHDLQAGGLCLRAEHKLVTLRTRCLEPGRATGMRRDLATKQIEQYSTVRIRQRDRDDWDRVVRHTRVEAGG